MHGVSTRSVDDLVAALGVDSGISKSEVSRICAGLDREIAAFRTRTLQNLVICPRSVAETQPRQYLLRQRQPCVRVLVGLRQMRPRPLS